MKLRYKLNILIIGITILSMSLPASIFFVFSKTMLKEQVDNYLQAELSKHTYEINGWIDTQSQTVITISDIIQNAYDKEDITSDLLQSYISNNNISDIYIGFSDGSFISGMGWIPDADYDPRNRPWYKETMAIGKLNVSNVYFDYTSEQYAVAIGIPLKDKQGNLIGVLSEDILLSTLYSKICDIQLEDYGYAYLVDAKGKIIVHRDAALVGENFNQYLSKGDMDSSSNEKSGKGSYTYKNIKKIVVYESIKNTNWKLVLVIGMKHAYKPLDYLMIIYISIIAATILVVTFLTRIFNVSIIRRLRLLSNASISLSEGKFDIEIEDLGEDEIGEVSKAFDRMKSEIKSTISELDSSRMKYEELIENTTEIIYSVDVEGYLITANTTCLNLFGIERKAMRNEKFSNQVTNSELGGILNALEEEVIEKRQLISREINVENSCYNVTVSPIIDKNLQEVKGVTVILHDTSDLRQYRNNLEWITHHDSLTKLPNRFKLMEDMYSVILKAKTNRKQCAVLFIDLDDFKSINDTLGYAVGDIILQKVAELLLNEYSVYRIGADEFVVILDEFESSTQLHQIVENISNTLNHNFEIELNTVYISSTIGVAIYPKDFTDIHEMMIRADATLNYAKKNNKSSVQFFESSISQELENRVILEKGLRKALDKGEFLLYYQAIVDGTTHSTKGFEALIRWRNRDGIIVSPGEFMPIAENMTIIHDLGFWIIEQALTDLKKFQKEFDRNFTMAINLSANQIKLPNFGEKVNKIILQSGVDPHCIIFEITESILIESLEFAKKQFQTLLDLGVKISLDDFGTGYSSLNYIQHFPFHIIKIDKSFIDFIKQETASQSIVKHIIDIAHDMEMEIVAEGVENEFQKDYLQEKKCDYYQGYLFSRPLPVMEVYRYILKNN